MVEHHHRDRAQIEERIKDAKLGVSLRRLPLSDLDANRVWLHCSTLALNLLALLNDLMFGIDPPGHLPRRRQAKFVRRMLLCVPARVTTSEAKTWNVTSSGRVLSGSESAGGRQVPRSICPMARSSSTSARSRDQPSWFVPRRTGILRPFQGTRSR